MDDINKSISDILSDPGKMQMLQNMASQFFNQNEPEKPTAPTNSAEDLIGSAKGLSSLISAMGNTNLGGDDESVRLLLALRPHLKDERKLRVDTAVKILKLIRLAPILKQSGLLNI